MTDPQTPNETPPGATPPERPQGGTGRMFGLVALAALAGGLAGALALYGMNALPGNAPVSASPAVQAQAPAPAAASAEVKDPACAPAVDRAKALAPLVKGEVAAFTLVSEPRRVPPLTFADDQGRALTLADTAGKVRLVNLWATWCVPCRKEMPALDQLQASLGGEDFQVVAINLDTREKDKPRAFLDEIGVKALTLYTDPATKSFQALRAAGRGFGLPTTLLVDRDGCEVGFLAGPAEWASEDAKALIAGALGKRPG